MALAQRLARAVPDSRAEDRPDSHELIGAERRRRFDESPDPGEDIRPEEVFGARPTEGGGHT